jgi:hypothetical protein
MIIGKVQGVRINTEYSDPLLLDCYQNLQALVLRNMGKDTDLFGYCWPWEFVLKGRTNNGLMISDLDCLEEKEFEELFQVNYHEQTITDKDDCLKEIRKAINQGWPVIVSFDEFYSFYHYKHVYMKEHGDHAILIVDYDDEQMQVDFISAIPSYRGKMTYNALLEGVFSLDNRVLIRIESKENYYKKSSEEIWNVYKSKLSKIRNHYENKCTITEIKVGSKLYAPQILGILKDIEGKPEKDICVQLSSLLDGSWIWHIDRKAQWSLRTFHNSGIQIEEKRIIAEYFDQVISRWVLISRILFKFTLTNKVNRFHEVIKSLEEIVELDGIFFDVIDGISLNG